MINHERKICLSRTAMLSRKETRKQLKRLNNKKGFNRKPKNKKRKLQRISKFVRSKNLKTIAKISISTLQQNRNSK